MESRAAPYWFVVGALIASLVLRGSDPAGFGAVSLPDGSVEGLDRARLPPGSTAPRALRVVPGVGRFRALEISDWVAERGVPGDWTELPGVGPRTASRLREARVGGALVGPTAARGAGPAHGLVGASVH